jgi:enamine deaminase RidA (YjgF/YER057c/UK114 family)
MIQRIPNPFSANFSNATIVPPNEYSTIYIAGQVGHPPAGPVKVTAATFEEEARLCFGNIRLALEKAGATMKDVVRITAYLTNLSDYPAYDRVRKETFPDSPPASASVQVAGLLVGAHLEIDAIAVIKTK